MEHLSRIAFVELIAVRRVSVLEIRIRISVSSKATIFALFLIALQQGALATDWSYCVAPSEADKRIYISLPFPWIGSRAEALFGAALATHNFSFDIVECARTDDESDAAVMRQHAIDVNRQEGREVIETHWRPAG